MTQTIFSPNQTPFSNWERPYDRDDWKRGYQSQPQEWSGWLDDIEGEIPPQLQGTLFRNGPGLLDINGMRIQHPFDGDGMVCALTLSEGRAYFRNRFVQTEGFVEEQKAGKILYRGAFGTQKPGGWLANAFDLQPKKIANTNVIYWGGKLLALWEAAEPYRLDPVTLQTEGIDLLDGILAPGDVFAAHPRIDPACQFADGEPVLVNFAIAPGLSTTLKVYELDRSGKLLYEQTHSVPGFAFIHDFAITPNYCIFFQNPVSFNPIPFVLGLRGAGECIKFRPEQKTRAIVVPRRKEIGRSPQFIELDSGFVFHHANAWETGANQIAIDSICYAFFPDVEPNTDFRNIDFDALAPGQLYRFNLDLAQETSTSELIESRCCEFPSLNPAREGRSYRYVYLSTAHQSQGNAPQQAILKLDLATGDRQFWSAAPERSYTGEPVFVPQPDAEAEDEGWVLSLIYNAAYHRSELVILDARHVDRGPIARVRLERHIPYGLHGSWAGEKFLPAS